MPALVASVDVMVSSDEVTWLREVEELVLVSTGLLKCPVHPGHPVEQEVMGEVRGRCPCYPHQE